MKAASLHGLAARAWRFLTRPHGNRLWDGLIRGTGILGLLGILAAHLVPGSGPLLGLAIFALWVMGPLSPLFPVALEPVLMIFGRLYPPLAVAGLATAAGIYIEVLNYHLYGRLLGLERARGFRESRTIHLLEATFRRAPFLAVWLAAFTPVPYWGVRILAALSRYPLRRYLTATLLGRFPKFWLAAALGLYLQVSAEVLLAIAATGSLVAVGLWIVRRLRQALRPTRRLRGAKADGG